MPAPHTATSATDRLMRKCSFEFSVAPQAVAALDCVRVRPESRRRRQLVETTRIAAAQDDVVDDEGRHEELDNIIDMPLPGAASQSSIAVLAEILLVRLSVPVG